MFHPAKKQPRSFCRRQGVTLVDVLVVSCVVRVWLTIALPAVSASREANRREDCAARMRNVAMAVANYAATNQEQIPKGIDSISRYTAQSAILPYLEAANVAKLFEKFQGTADTSSNATKVRLPVYICPSDNPADIYKSPGGGQYARSNFVFCFGSGTLLDQDAAKRGYLRVDVRLSFGDVDDGAANTALVSEIIAGKTAEDPSGAWGYGEAGSCAYTHKSPPLSGKGAAPVLAKSARDFSTAFATASSMHPEGINVVYGDMHVGQVSPEVDRAAWQAMGTTHGREKVVAPAK